MESKQRHITTDRKWSNESTGSDPGGGGAGSGAKKRQILTTLKKKAAAAAAAGSAGAGGSSGEMSPQRRLSGGSGLNIKVKMKSIIPAYCPRLRHSNNNCFLRH